MHQPTIHARPTCTQPNLITEAPFEDVILSNQISLPERNLSSVGCAWPQPQAVRLDPQPKKRRQKGTAKTRRTEDSSQCSREVLQKRWI